MTTAPPHPAAHAASSWHLAGALVSLRAAVDAHWPKRDHASDGGIGDARHQAEGGPDGPGSGSDHNPWLNNTVRAYDFDDDGIDAPWLAEQLRLLGLSGDPRLAGKSGRTDDNGYVIWNRHITAPDFSRWVAYSGDPHTTHVHVSVTRDPSGYEYGGAWSFLAHVPLHPPAQPAPKPAPATGHGPHPGNTAHAAPYPDGDRAVDEPGFPDPGHDAVGKGDGFRAQYGNHGSRIMDLQEELNQQFPAYSHLVVDGDYGRETAAVIEEVAQRAAHAPECPEADRQGLLQADGNTVGPRLARVFSRYGLNL